MNKTVYHTNYKVPSITKVIVPSSATLSDGYPTLALALNTMPKNSQIALCSSIAQDLGIMVADDMPLEKFNLDPNRQLSYTINLKV